MKWSISIACILIFVFRLQGQIEISHEVVGCLGSTNVLVGNKLIDATAGEAIISTETSSQYTCTQGFHQPMMNAALSFSVVAVDASCPTSTDGAARIENLTGCRGPYTIVWSVGHTGREVDRLGPGLYTVRIDAGLCSLIQEFSIGSGSETACRLLFFKAFSPNGDGKNDEWEIENIHRPEFSENRVEVFNRWGQSVWTGEGYNNEDVVWDGKTKNGIELSDGTYFYVATVNEIVYKGYVELTR